MALHEWLRLLPMFARRLASTKAMLPTDRHGEGGRKLSEMAGRGEGERDLCLFYPYPLSSLRGLSSMML